MRSPAAPSTRARRRGEPTARRPAVESEHPPHVEPEAVDGLRACLVEVDPQQVVAPLDEEPVGQLRADPAGDAVRERGVLERRLPSVADVTEPRIPPANPLRRARGDVRVDPGPWKGILASRSKAEG